MKAYPPIPAILVCINIINNRLSAKYNPKLSKSLSKGFERPASKNEWNIKSEKKMYNKWI